MAKPKQQLQTHRVAIINKRRKYPFRFMSRSREEQLRELVPKPQAKGTEKANPQRQQDNPVKGVISKSMEECWNCGNCSHYNKDCKKP